jgi:hypothetical protein
MAMPLIVGLVVGALVRNGPPRNPAPRVTYRWCSETRLLHPQQPTVRLTAARDVVTGAVVTVEAVAGETDRVGPVSPGRATRRSGARSSLSWRPGVQQQ